MGKITRPTHRSGLRAGRTRRETGSAGMLIVSLGGVGLLNALKYIGGLRPRHAIRIRSLMAALQ